MAHKIIMVDTSILIDFYRKTDKNNRSKERNKIDAFFVFHFII